MSILSEFVRPGDLVFDIGANTGDYARACLALGAQVVSVEPQPDACAALAGLPVMVVQAAVGDAPGTATLHRTTDSRYSSLLPDWIDAHRGYWGWDDRAVLEVKQITLDMLIAGHGTPDFLKIDTEGFEDRVLAGLSTPVDRLSFEYHGGAYPLNVALDVPARAIRRLQELGDYQFRFAAESTRWVSDWVGPDAAVDVLGGLDWGDVYALRR